MKLALTTNRSTEAGFVATRPPVAGKTHIGDAIEAFLAELLAEVDLCLEATRGFSGPIRESQRLWSRMFDEIEAARQESE